MGAAFGAGFILGPALGGLLGELGPRAPFFAAAGLSLLNFAYGYFVLPETLDESHRRSFDWRRANPVGTLLQIRKHPLVLGLLLSLFLWQIAHQVMPSIQSLMTHRVAANAQGELQGAVAGLQSLSAIIAPPLMTQLFRRFTADGASVHFPGAPFLLASMLAVGALILFWSSARSEAKEEGAL